MTPWLTALLLAAVVTGPTIAIYGWKPDELRVSRTWYFLLALALLANTLDVPNTVYYVFKGVDLKQPMSVFLSRIGLFLFGCYLVLRYLASLTASMIKHLRKSKKNDCCDGTSCCGSTED